VWELPLSGSDREIPPLGLHTSRRQPTLPTNSTFGQHGLTPSLGSFHVGQARLVFVRTDGYPVTSWLTPAIAQGPVCLAEATQLLSIFEAAYDLPLLPVISEG
jgi:hypothetical protein